MAYFSEALISTTPDKYRIRPDITNSLQPFIDDCYSVPTEGEIVSVSTRDVGRSHINGTADTYLTVESLSSYNPSELVIKACDQLTIQVSPLSPSSPRSPSSPLSPLSPSLPTGAE
jgi:hypothetical protein